MRLLHYSTEPLVEVATVEQLPDEIRPPGKPHGLWCSVEGEDDWIGFCRYNWSTWFDDVHHCTEVVLRGDAELLVVDTEVKLRALNQKFPRRGGGHSLADTYFKSPEWGAIAGMFGGIVIAPYQWGCRHDSRNQWYYGWDAASACVWDAAVVDRLVPRPDLLEYARREMDEARRADA